MSKLNKSLSDIDLLRKQALTRHPRKHINTQGMSADDIAKAFFNLETHKIELELQSEEMLRVNNELLHAKDEYIELYDDAPVGYFTLNLSGSIIKCNKACRQILGLTSTQAINKRFSDFVAPSGQDKYFITHRELLKTKKAASYEIPLQLTNGNEHWVSVEAMHVSDKNGEQAVIRLAISDINKRINLEAERRKLACAVKFSSSGVYIMDLNGIIEYVNPKFCDITGYKKEQLIGKTPWILKSDDTSKQIYDAIWNSISAGIPWSGEFQNKRKDGSLYWAKSFISFVENDDGVVTHYVAIQNDITKEYELNAQLNYQASHDVLTNLINRNEMERRMRRLLTDKSNVSSRHAFCFMDLDQFKIINDTCGHFAGDQLLKQIADLLHKSVRKRDTLARLGGDEFALLMEHCSLEKAKDVANSMLNAVKEFRFFWEGQSFQIGISLGLVEIEPYSANLDEFMKQADAACYVAKRLGRNRVHLYCPDDKELARRYGEMQWLSHINRAFNEDNFRIYAQPIKAFDQEPQKVHYEMLLRMQGSNGEIISPEVFLPAAERYGLMTKIDTWVIETVITKLTARPEFLKSVEFISINLSGASMTNASLVEVIKSAIEKTGIAAEKICFEITETAAISNMAAAVELVNTLKSLGCQFALDDFGTGLSSFSYLKNLPVNFLKIDGMFIQDIANDELNEVMVKSINEIAHVMQIRTVAEFVENAKTYDMLKVFGVDYGQGFYLGPPLPLDDLMTQAERASKKKLKQQRLLP